MHSVPPFAIGEVVDYYLRVKDNLIEYGDLEIEFKFAEHENWLIGNICTLLENKLMDCSKRG